MVPSTSGFALGLVLCSVMACGSTSEDAPGAGEEEGTPSSELPDDSKTGGPSDADPDHDADPNTPSPPDDPATSPATQLELVKKFAPHLRLHPEDGNKPANVDWYLSRVTMRFHHAKCPDHEILGLGKVTQQSLIAQSHDDNKSLCRHDGAKNVKSTESDHFFLEIADEATRAGAPRDEWKTYVVWRPRAEGGLVDVEYWAFYPFNDNVAFFNHESDWEHVRITIDPKADGEQGKAIEIKFSQHHGGEILKADDAKLTMEGTHVVSYVAKGSHANYPKPGTYDIEGTGGVAKDRTAPGGTAWSTEESVVLIGTRAQPKNGQVFVKYWGRWGELGDLPETDGVTRHFP